MQCKTVISVVIPIYNAEKYIDRCLESVLEQNISEIEVICVDDGSTDSSYSILKEWERQNDNVHVLRQKNSHAGVARNLGMSIAKGDYIHFLDVDDYVVSGIYEKIFDVIRGYHPDFIKAKAYAIDMQTDKLLNDNPYSMKNVPQELFGKILSFQEYSDVLLQLSPVPWNGIVKKEYIQRKCILFNDLKCVNDRSFFINAISHTEKIYLLDDYIVWHQVNNPKSLAGGRRTKENFHCCIEAYGLIPEIIGDLPCDLQNKVFSNELIEFANDFSCLKEEVQEAYKILIKKKVVDVYLKNATVQALDNLNVKKMYCIVNEIEWNMNEIRIMDLEKLEDICTCSDEIVIYGAGRVCYALLQYMSRRWRMLDKVFCIMVSNKVNNPDNVLGIPVCTKAEVGVRKDATVLIATFENAHEEICFNLCTYQHKRTKAIGNVLYAELRRKNQDLSVDIIQNTQWIRDDLRRVKNEMLCTKGEILQAIRILNDKLVRMETCLQNGVRYSDELLQPNQYEDALKNWYQSVTGKVLDLNNPQTYNEKIQWIKLYGVTPLMTKLTDKYAVREWVKDKIGEEYLVPLLGVWDSFDEIDIDALPDRFVLKCNHGSAWNEVVKDKVNWNWREAKKKFDRWMNTNFAFRGGLQMQYKDIQPKIIAEKYLEDKEHNLNDYKFMCFNGKVELFWIDTERTTDHRRNVFDIEGTHLDYFICYAKAENPPKLPDTIHKMMELSKILSEGLPHVRVDLYSVDEKIYFGEMTFTSGNGAEKMLPHELEYRLGELIQL